MSDVNCVDVLTEKSTATFEKVRILHKFNFCSLCTSCCHVSLFQWLSDSRDVAKIGKGTQK